jgi:hypothetical protein
VAYRHFAEKLYPRIKATPIDQGIIELLDSNQRPVNHLLAVEPDKAEVLNTRKCGSTPGGDGKFVGVYKVSARLCVLRWRVVPVEA